MLKYIFSIIVAFALYVSVPICAAMHGHKIPVNLDQITLKGGIENLSQIFGMQIVLISNHSKSSQDRFSLNLEQATLEQSITAVMRRAKVQNHALFLNQDNKTVKVWILSSGQKEAMGRKVRNNMLYENDSETLTPHQMFLLAQHSQGPAQIDDKPLTLEQIRDLQEQSVSMEAETEESMKPLTPEQIDQLQEQSLWIKGETQEAQNPLSPEQMEQLRKHHGEIESENESALQPLSKEQLLLLKKQEEEQEY
jgi:hypothetical protein